LNNTSSDEQCTIATSAAGESYCGHLARSVETAADLVEPCSQGNISFRFSGGAVSFFLI
jgi:hypothetical protein